MGERARLQHTCVLVVKFEEITLLVEFVGVAVEERKDGQKLRDGIFVEFHEGRVMS